MIKQISAHVANWLVKEGTVSEVDRELYRYAAYSFLFGLLPFFISVLFGAFMGIVKESLLIMLPFILVRKFSGGYHLQSSRTCFMLSLSVIVAACSSTKWLLSHRESYTVFSIIVLLACCSLCSLSPVDSEARKLNKKEKKLFRRLAQMFSLITLLIYYLLLNNRSIHLAVPTGMGLILAAFLQIPCLLHKAVKWK